MATLDELRPQLMGLAYRILGTRAEAEDAVQEALARWAALPADERRRVRAVEAWLRVVTGRVCFDRLRSAAHRRERYVGPWLPEPLSGALDDADVPTPEELATLGDSLSLGFVVMLQALTPAQRVVFVLHDLFQYTFEECGHAVGRTPEACRQLAVVARRKLKAARTTVVDPSSSAIGAAGTTRAREELVQRFLDAWVARDVGVLVELLDPRAVAVTDGGGQVTARVDPVEGARAISSWLVAVLDRNPELSLSPQRVNGEPGALSHRRRTVEAVISFEVDRAAERVTRIWIVRNPAKLARWRAPHGHSADSPEQA